MGNCYLGNSGADTHKLKGSLTPDLLMSLKQELGVIQEILIIQPTHTISQNGVEVVYLQPFHVLFKHITYTKLRKCKY